MKNRSQYEKDIISCLPFPISGMEFLQRWNIEKDKKYKAIMKGKIYKPDPFFEGLYEKIQAVEKKHGKISETQV
jgi:hypothetical protein